jgi:hypothetical protein
VLDVLFWLMAAAGLFLIGCTVGGGKIRPVFAVAAAMGAALYFVSVSKICLRLWGHVVGGLAILLKALAFPFTLAEKFFKKIYFFLKNLFHYLKKRYKIRVLSCSRLSTKQKFPSKGAESREAEKGKYIYEACSGGSRDLRRSHSRIAVGENRDGPGRQRPAAGADK